MKITPLLLSLALPFLIHGQEPSAALQKVEVQEYAAPAEVRMDIAAMVAEGKVQPAAAIRRDDTQEGCWLLRTPENPPKWRWPTSLLNWRKGAPDLTIDPGLKGSYDIYAEVHAVDAGTTAGAAAQPTDALPMAFTLELDDGSKREVVGAKGFPGHHFDVEVQACHAWDLTGHKLVLHTMGKPVYLTGFRFAPAANHYSKTEKAMRWVATDHVTIVKEQEKHFAFPGVALLKNGDLVVVYREAAIHLADPAGKISLSRSTDGGRTWLPRVTALDRPKVDDRDPGIFQMSDGTVVLTAADMLCTSTDSGQTWTKPRPTPVFGPRGAVEDEEGNIVYGGQQREVQHGELTRINGRPVFLKADAAYRSRDKGKSWEPVGVAAYTTYAPGPMNYLWLDEPFMCVVPHKYWVFGARVDLDGYARIIRSPDRGKTWEPIIKTPVWGYPPHLLPLRDGRLLMSYSYRRPPWGVRACLSNDNGKTWDVKNEIILRMDGGTPEGQPFKVINMDLGYPASLQLPDGRIFTVYYLNTAGTNPFIAGTFWNLPDTGGKK